MGVEVEEECGGGGSVGGDGGPGAVGGGGDDVGTAWPWLELGAVDLEGDYIGRQD